MILATRDGDVQVRDVSLGSLMALNGIPLRGDAGGYASSSDVAGLPAFQQAIRIASESIAKLTLAVWRGKAPKRTLVEATWQARLFASPPNERGDTWFYTWEGTEASLTARNNAYWLKSHDLLTGRVNRVQLWHPDGVRARWHRQARRAEYQLLLEDGSWSDWLTSVEVLHFRKGAPAPGAVVAPSPLELHRRTWATAVEKQRAEQAVYAKGNKKTVAVVFPDTVTPEQADRWREVYFDGQADSDVKVFGGNPRVETIGLSFEDLQFIETQQFSIEDVGRMLGVPPSLLWAASPKGDKPLTPEHEEDRWFRHGSEPRRTRIEQTIAVDPDFFGVGARDYPMFIAAPIRADRDTEVRSYVSLTQAGIIVPDTAAEALGFPPLPDGLGQIVQITPVGGAPNEKTPAPAPSEAAAAPAPATPIDIHVRNDTDEKRTKLLLDEIRAGREAQHEELKDIAEAHVRSAQLLGRELAAGLRELPPPTIDVRTAEQPAPVIHVEVPAPVVNVTVPEQPPAAVVVNVPKDGSKKLTVERSGQGWIKSATIEDS